MDRSGRQAGRQAAMVLAVGWEGSLMVMRRALGGRLERKSKWMSLSVSISVSVRRCVYGVQWIPYCMEFRAD